MWNRYQPYRRGIRFFPHIVPIAFPLIFPLGIGLAFALAHALFHVIGFLLFVALIFFVVRAITLRNRGSAWSSMGNMGYRGQWFTSRQQQSPFYQPQEPYYQPSTPAGQEPYYQPSQASQAYGRGYQAEQTSYQQAEQSSEFDQPRAEYPEQMPPMQQ